MNVIWQCYNELFSEYGPEMLACLPSVSEPWQQAQANPPQVESRIVRVRGRKPISVPAGTLKFVAATCSSMLSESPGAVLFEPLSSNSLPEGLLISPALLKVVRGTAYVPIVNVGTTPAVLHPRRSVGLLMQVEVVDSLAETTTIGCPGATTATVNTQMRQISPIQKAIQALDLTALPISDQEKVRSLLLKYESVFSAFEGDLGCTNLISHDIPVLDDVPVRQRYRRI